LLYKWFGRGFRYTTSGIRFIVLQQFYGYMVEIDLPRTLYTYSSYFDTITSIAYLNSKEANVYPASLANKLGKSKSTVSDQVSGYLSEHNIVQINKPGKRKLLLFDLTQFANIYIEWYKLRIKQVEEEQKFLEQKVPAATADKHQNDLYDIINPDNLKENEYLEKAIVSFLNTYGESVLQGQGGNRGYLAAHLDWSLRDFFKYFTKKINYLTAANDAEDEAYDQFNRFAAQSVLVRDHPVEAELKKQAEKLFQS